MPRADQSRLAWIGLLLFAACLVWLDSGERRKKEVGQLSTGSVRTVIIDPGHGGNDSGAMRGSIAEKALTLDVARRLAGLLQAQGIATVLTRDDDRTVSLVERTAIANAEENSVFVSIHFDEGARADANGVGSFIASEQKVPVPLLASWIPFVTDDRIVVAPVESSSLAGLVQRAVVEKTGSLDRGVREQNFFVVRNVRHPAVLVEGGFLSNASELEKIQSSEYRQQIASGICAGILQYSQLVRRRGDTVAVASSR